MKKRKSHENTGRLTNRERAQACATWIMGTPWLTVQRIQEFIQRHMSAACREALARNDRRVRKGR